MAQLAIKGHATRGKEVIEILEMLGGKNIWSTVAFYKPKPFYIDKDGIIMAIDSNSPMLLDTNIFTLEQFLEKFPYKVGDKVCFSDNPKHCLTIKEVRWVSNCNDLEYKFYENDIVASTEELQSYKELKTMEKKDLDWRPTDYLEFVDNDDTWANEVELNLGDSYEIQVRDGKTYVARKQPQYPKTYSECLEVKGTECVSVFLLNKFEQLLNARNAYWKLAGDWKPDWCDKKALKYTIHVAKNKVVKDTNWTYNSIFAFPTEEMRDAFYENFGKPIDECKELL